MLLLEIPNQLLRVESPGPSRKLPFPSGARATTDDDPRTDDAVDAAMRPLAPGAAAASTTIPGILLPGVNDRAMAASSRRFRSSTNLRAITRNTSSMPSPSFALIS